MRITAQQYANTWYHILKTAAAPEAAAYSQAILIKLMKTGHARWLTEITRLIAEMDRQERGICKVLVKVAHPISDETVMDFLQENLAAKSYEIQTQIEPSLLAGVQIETDETRWNISVGEKLKQLYRSISGSELQHR